MEARGAAGDARTEEEDVEEEGTLIWTETGRQSQGESPLSILDTYWEDSTRLTPGQRRARECERERETVSLKSLDLNCSV